MRPSQPLLAIDPQVRHHDGTSISLLRDLCIWPFQWLTYATLLYSLAYILLTYLALFAVAPVLILAACLVPYAVFRSLVSLFTQRSAVHWYPWSELYACTRALLITDVWLHNQFARRSQYIAATYDFSRPQSRSCKDQPRFVLRMIEVNSPSGLLTTWAYLLVVRTVVAMALACLYGGVIVEVGNIVAVAVNCQRTGMCYSIVETMNCDVETVAKALYLLTVMLMAVASRSLVLSSLGRTTRFFASETVLNLGHHWKDA